MSKEAFKGFIQSHPELVTHVNQGTMTWQKFYEMYDIYGENDEIWKSYLTSVKKQDVSSKIMSDLSLQEFVNMLKKVDLDTVRKGVNGLQKAIGIIQELGVGNNKKIESKNNYEPRPMYKYFED